eukprot:TRINITY_DN3097_c0_g1_i2.p1 TRINITY_DN3097_c0_g1~~TRINITY_DN3097_c0_g1_i2.p1  ORF type:complete len:238 (-),score=34.21 TRINITY_DN3097_c0_g1_i2:47-760(-)
MVYYGYWRLLFFDVQDGDTFFLCQLFHLVTECAPLVLLSSWFIQIVNVCVGCLPKMFNLFLIQNTPRHRHRVLQTTFIKHLGQLYTTILYLVVTGVLQYAYDQRLTHFYPQFTAVSFERIVSYITIMFGMEMFVAVLVYVLVRRIYHLDMILEGGTVFYEQNTTPTSDDNNNKKQKPTALLTNYARAPCHATPPSTMPFLSTLSLSSRTWFIWASIFLITHVSEDPVLSVLTYKFGQ